MIITTINGREFISRLSKFGLSGLADIFDTSAAHFPQ
jgi:hypothetical protein